MVSATTKVVFKAATWNLGTETLQVKLAPVLDALLAESTSIFTLQSAHGSVVTRLLKSRQLESSTFGSLRVVWNPESWSHFQTMRIHGAEAFMVAGKEKFSDLLLTTLKHKDSGAILPVLCYETPPRMQRMPKRRMVALKATVQRWKELAEQQGRFLAGGTDYIDEDEQHFEFMSEENTGLTLVQPPTPTLGRRKVDDFRTKGLGIGIGLTVGTSSGHKAHVREFSMRAKIEQPKPTWFKLRFITQNVQALPRMPQADVISDVTLTASQADVVAWQEINPDRYEAALLGLGPSWKHQIFPDPNGGVPISYKSRPFIALDGGLYELHNAGITGFRCIAWILLKHKATEAEFLVHNWHYVPGAWNNKPDPQEHLRKPLWLQDQRRHKAFLRPWIAKGVPIIGGGDSNSKLSRQLLLGSTLANQSVRYPVDPHSIDHIVLIDGAEWKWVLEDKDGQLLKGRKGDHQGRRAIVQLVKTPTQS